MSMHRGIAERQQRKRRRSWPQRLWRVAFCAGVASLPLGAGGVFLGSVGLIGLTLYALMAIALGVVAVWVALVVGAIRRRFIGRRWLLRALGGTAYLAVLALAVHLVWLWPARRYHSREFRESATTEQGRSLCHWVLLWHPDPHDQFLHLRRGGDASSVPYIIWAMRWMPWSGHGPCTWDHGFEALTTITNQSPGSTRLAWGEWYHANKHLSQEQWWADGFRAEGYPVSADGGAASARELLAVLGRTLWGQYESKRWLSLNATRLLKAFDGAEIRSAMSQVLRGGTAQQRRGLARHAPELARAQAEPILRELLQDQDRSVRLWASAMLCRRQCEWLRNPDGFIVKAYERGELDPEAFFGAPAKVGLSAKAATRRNRPGRVTIGESWVQVFGGASRPGGRGLPACFIRLQSEGDDYRRPESVSLEGASPASGKTVYSRELITSTEDKVHELGWLLDRARARVYVSIADFTCAADIETGELLWEIGIGPDYCDYLLLLGDYLVMVHGRGDLLICDAESGAVLACYGLERERFDERLALVGGHLHARDGDGRLYVLRLPRRTGPSTAPAEHKGTDLYAHPTPRTVRGDPTSQAIPAADR